eukprot:CAMPEP_0173294920 /NCGR_PEP_ID=MMETSP1143-20121109/14153_1 /TAXON_ID=483371 /ORGANISM="non described non described, Strain CCMP2298" /LENGTH=33 /DNA_ID= /DNA_START= /DNA_END= /DNA_ORIENTATION=
MTALKTTSSVMGATTTARRRVRSPRDTSSIALR